MSGARSPRHVEAMLELSDRGAIVFEYGNNIRAQARDAGVTRRCEIPGFVAAYVRPIWARGVGPYRWIDLTGDPEDLRRSEDALMEVVGTPDAGAVDQAGPAAGRAAGPAGAYLLAGTRASATRWR